MTRRDWIAFAVILSISAMIVTAASVYLPVYQPTARTIVVKERLILGDEKKIVQTLIDQLLTEKNAKCFKNLLAMESHTNPKAKNPTSSAKGVGQLLDSTYRNLGMRHSADAISQTVAALAYIGRKYGSAGPCAAWRHFQRNYWY